MKFKKKPTRAINNGLLILSLILITLSVSYAQTNEQIQKYRKDNYGNESEKKKGLLEGNNVRTIFYNDGQFGNWSNLPSGEWPKGSSQSYINGYTLLLGAEFTAPGNSQVVHSVTGSYDYGVDEDPVTGKKWILEPIPGYSNPYSLTPAISTDSSSWPSKWPTATFGIDDTMNGKWWYGIDAKYNPYRKVPAGTVESFFVMDDSKDFEYSRAPYSFFPVKDDLKRGGLGLRIETRIIQPSEPDVENVIFNVYDISNISDYEYEKFVLGLLVDPNIGTGTESANETISYSLEENIVYAFDSVDFAPPGTIRPGYFGVALFPAYYSTGRVSGINSVNAEVVSNNGPNSLLLKNDEYLWNKLTNASFIGLQTGANQVFVIGVKPFSLSQSIGDPEKFVTAFIWGSDPDDLYLNKLSANTFCEKYILPSSYPRHLRVTNLTSLTSLRELKEDIEIDYTVDPSSNYFRINLYVSTDGEKFSYYKSSVDSIGKFIVNTKDFHDGIFYKFKLLFSDGLYAEDYVIPNYFIINNTENVPPQIKFTTPNDSTYSFKEDINVQWISGDADSDPFITTIYFGDPLSNSWKFLYETTETGKLSYNWNTLTLANGNAYYLKAVLKNNTDSSIVFSKPFKINNQHKTVDGRKYSELFNSRGTGDFLFSIINPAEFTHDKYSLKFVKLADSISKGYTIQNITKNKTVIPPTLLQKSKESDLFDGVRVIVNDDERKEAIKDSTKWISRNCNYDVYVLPDHSCPTRDIFQPFDYKIMFYNYPVYTTPFTKTSLNLRVINTITNQPVDCELYDNDGNHEFNLGDDIVLVEYPNNDSQFRLSWDIQFRFPCCSPTTIDPQEGDILVFSSCKPFQIGDEIIFSTSDLEVGIEGKRDLLPKHVELDQNYPNPFNSQTVINYEISSLSKVEIKVFDVLGREVKTLLNEVKSAGKYKVVFNTNGLPSGVYFYRIKTPSFSKTKKMVYLK